MSVIFLVLPLAVVLAGVWVGAFLLSARRGQFDELDTPAWRVLFDDDGAAQSKRPAGAPPSPLGRTPPAPSLPGTGCEND